MDQLLNIAKDIVTIGTIASIAITVLARLLPNAKVYGFGWSIGAFLTRIGNLRLGKATCNKIEEFLENSIQQFASGFVDGLESDDGVVKKDIPTPKPADIVKK